MHDLLDPKNDFVFKRIFGSEENKDILLAFLNRTFLYRQGLAQRQAIDLRHSGANCRRQAD